MLRRERTSADFDYTSHLDDNPVRVASVNLDRPWQSIHNRLLEVIDTPVPGANDSPV